MTEKSTEYNASVSRALQQEQKSGLGEYGKAAGYALALLALFAAIYFGGRSIGSIHGINSIMTADLLRGLAWTAVGVGGLAALGVGYKAIHHGFKPMIDRHTAWHAAKDQFRCTAFAPHRRQAVKEALMVALYLEKEKVREVDAQDLVGGVARIYGEKMKGLESSAESEFGPRAVGIYARLVKIHGAESVGKGIAAAKKAEEESKKAEEEAQAKIDAEYADKQESFWIASTTGVPEALGMLDPDAHSHRAPDPVVPARLPDTPEAKMLSMFVDTNPGGRTGVKVGSDLLEKKEISLSHADVESNLSRVRAAEREVSREQTGSPLLVMDTWSYGSGDKPKRQ